MGAMVMTHSDDEGLVLPPMLAPIQVVAVPIYKTEEEFKRIEEKFMALGRELKAKGIRFKFDGDDNKRPGWKFNEYEVKGVPIRLAMGPRDLENGLVELARRDTKEKSNISFVTAIETVEQLLLDIQSNLLERSIQHRNNNTFEVDTYEEFKQRIDDGGFFLAHWDGTEATEELVKNETKATIRCIPFTEQPVPGKCMVTGQPSAQRVIFAKAY
jgi:prolyl-tRNA synthetase